MSQTRKFSQSGSFLLLTAAFMLPVAFVFATYTLDIYSFNHQRNLAQQAVDLAAVAASKKLPYIGVANLAANLVLEQAGFKNGATINITPDNVEVKYEGRHKTFLSRFSSKGYTDYRVYSAAHINSKDVVLFMDTSSYLAPAITNDVKVAWNTKHNWPFAKYFRDKVDKKYKGNKVPARILTQQCFNSAFSSLKEATLRLYDYYSSHGRNSVGVMMGPSSDDSIRMLRPLGTAYKNGTSPGEGIYDYFRSRYATDEMCLAAAQYELNHRGYNIPPRSQELPTTKYTGATFRLVNDKHELPASNLRHLAIRDILWTAAVRREYEGEVQTPKILDFRNVLLETTNALLAAPYRSERKEISNKQAAIAVLMLGDLPWINGQRLRSYPIGTTKAQINAINVVDRKLHVNNLQAIKLLRRTIKAINANAAKAKRQLQIYINFTRHLGNYPSEWYPQCVATDDSGSGNHLCREFNRDGEVLENIFKTYEQEGVFSSKNLIIRVFRSPHTEGMARNLAAWLPLADRTIFRAN